MLHDQAQGMLVATQGTRASSGSMSPAAAPRSDRGSYLIVVARDQPDLLRHLEHTLTGFQGVEVVLDRRWGGWWQWSRSREYQERGADRRVTPPNGESSLGNRSFLMIPRHGPR